MQHYHLNEFSLNNTFLHSLEPRTKTISILFLIAVAVTLHGLFALLCVLILAIALNIYSRIPISYLFVRLALALPVAIITVMIFPLIIPGKIIWSFTIMGYKIIFSNEGLYAAGIYILRFFDSFLLLIFLTASIGFSRFLHTLAQLKIPKIFLQLTEFAVRYIFVLHMERKKMLLARKARNFQAKSIFRDKKTLFTLAQTIGMLFFRAYERAERIYFSMLSRGYKGIMPVIKKQEIIFKDYIISGILVVFGIVCFLLDKGVIN